MARIRTVKPGLFRHEDLYDTEKAYQLPLRLAFIGLWTCCDREGRFAWQPRRLKLDMLPYDDDVDIFQVLEALTASGFIIKYENNNAIYGCIPSWSHHQMVNSREVDSQYPSHEDPESILIVAETINKNTTQPRVPHASQSCTRGREQEQEQEQEYENNLVAQARPCSSASPPLVMKSLKPDKTVSEVNIIFEHWQKTMAHPNAKLDAKRKSLIRKALQSGYEASQLCQAITGCAKTPHNMGDNDRGQRYDGLHVILRDADQIDRFIRNRHEPPRALTEGERRTQANVRVMEDWLAEKMTLEGEV